MSSTTFESYSLDPSLGLQFLRVFPVSIKISADNVFTLHGHVKYKGNVFIPVYTDEKQEKGLFHLIMRHVLSGITFFITS